ncbi:PREDICTED: myosin-binding protein 7-like [Lupinus angustifolius]|uniref:myosin-binding protein 7-like n=1 Tax=Lupinus angustifolius TaxID=3871 RepID=UPI00092EEFD9|nr:PREDICTED: myosin-binding protein 7-like [Lupinus angustifolius]XP_019453340.1 PREDICTED: myosin-binding protein 7-like [Lupinus angustifolius]
MDVELVLSSKDLLKCCNCGCSCSLAAQSSGTWMRSVKRKHDEFELDSGLRVPMFARIGIENECMALREMVSSQQKTIEDLNAELEEERNSASTAANEAMSMILRLQREKAEIQMESRQFKRFAEQKMSHDQEEFLSLEDLLYKREQIIQSLTCEVQAYKHRMMSFGLTEEEVEGEQYELSTYEYPALKCNVLHGVMDANNDDTDIEKYAFGENPSDRLRDLENRIFQMERSPTYSQMDGDYTGKNTFEKVIVGQSPRRTRHSRKFSSDSTSFGGMGRENGPDFQMDSPKVNNNSRKDNFSQSDDPSNLKKEDKASESDDTSDRIYTVDFVQVGAPDNGFTESKARGGAFEDYATSPRESGKNADFEDSDIKKLYMRLHALEADRESMRQAIISMSTDKAQFVLLKEIAQHLCKEMSPERRMTERKPSIVGSFSFFSIFTWITSVVFWRKRAHQSKYMFELPADSMGLLLLLDNGTHARPWRCISSTQVGD